MNTTAEILKEKTAKDLKKLAKNNKIAGYSKMTKSKLIDAIVKNNGKKEVGKKPARKKSPLVAFKSQANNNWKNETRSMSALVRYCQNEGKNDMQQYIALLNESKGSKLTIGNINTKNLVKFAKTKELQHKDGTKKTLFTLWFVENILSRMAKA